MRPGKHLPKEPESLLTPRGDYDEVDDRCRPG